MKKEAKLYRMVKSEHIYAYGLKSLDLLKRQGFDVEDYHLTSREDTDEFKEKYSIETTPQTFIGEKRIAQSLVLDGGKSIFS